MREMLMDSLDEIGPMEERGPIDEPGGSGGPRPGDLHTPVLAGRVADLLAPGLVEVPDPVFVDATMGMGGHSLLLLAAHPRLRVIGIDRDPDALRIASRRLTEAGFAERVELVHAVYDEIGEVLSGHPAGVQGILFDLGVSSLQLDQTDRGFAYSVDAPLDMRMDPTTGISAADVLNTYAAGDLARVLSRYGEERFARRIAAAVVRERAVAPFTDSGRLVELIRASIPAAARRTGGHPAKRTFQALRIEVNDELGALTTAIPAAVDALAVGGRIVVLAYQSLEDRIVKRALAPLTLSTAPLDLPIDLPGHEPLLRWLARSEVPTDDEITENPRAASARLRAAVRVRKATS